MSINIDKEDLREAMDFLNIARALPLWYSDDTKITYDGKYLIVTNLIAEYNAIGTGHSCPSYEANAATYLITAWATVKAVTTDTDCYFFFLEPRKAVYAEFQGFKVDGVGTHKMEFRSGGTEEEDLIAGQDWTVDTEFQIAHSKDQTVCYGYINGVLKATCTDAGDISAQPFSIYAAEPNGVARVMTLKYPPGIQVA